MGTAEELEQLAVRCEQAAGVDRALDSEIYEAAVGLKQYESIHVRPDGSICIRYYPGPPNPVYRALPRFTDSIDAALTLVPGHAIWTLEDGAAWVRTLSGDIVDEFQGFGKNGPTTTPRALCAAALRARAALSVAKGER